MYAASACVGDNMCHSYNGSDADSWTLVDSYKLASLKAAAVKFPQACAEEQISLEQHQQQAKWALCMDRLTS